MHTRSQRLRQRLGLPRRPHPYAGEHAAAELRVLRQRGAPVSGRIEAAHERPVDPLCERVERRLAPREIDRAPCIACLVGGEGKRLQERHGAIAVRIACFEHPLVVEPGQKRSLAERQRLLAAPIEAQAVGFDHVDPGVGGEPDAVAARHERVAERASQRPERTAQARSGALVQHVGPEPRRDVRARVETGVEREPAEQRQRPAARQRPGLAVHLDPDFAHEADAQHRQSLQRDV